MITVCEYWSLSKMKIINNYCQYWRFYWQWLLYLLIFYVCRVTESCSAKRYWTPTLLVWPFDLMRSALSRWVPLIICLNL
jgi:hypothetical protein